MVCIFQERIIPEQEYSIILKYILGLYWEGKREIKHFLYSAAKNDKIIDLTWQKLKELFK